MGNEDKTMNEKTEVSSWYNTYSKRQLKTGVNLRHFTIINELIRNGLKSNSSVLEIGCGVGTLTGLMLRYITRGSIVSTDISDESIGIAKQLYSQRGRAEFFTTDMKDFSYPSKFDFIVLADVLEHIPVDQHAALFATISAHMHEGSRIFINLPHPKALDFMREHNPELLQIIDQSIAANSLLNDAYSGGLMLLSYASKSIFDKESDYAMIWLKKDGPVRLKPLPKRSVIIHKLRARLRFYISSF
jgi:trans-aconitate 2-methyltransferase